MKGYSRGFIKKMAIIVVGICIVFIVFAVMASSSPLASYQRGTSLIDWATTDSGGGITTGTDYSSRTSGLLDFGSDNLFDDGNRSTPNTDGKGVSDYAGSISLSTGNAYSIQPVEEYLTLRNGTAASVNITGWTLTNSKGSRPIENSNNSYFYPSPDVAIIGQGTEFLDPSGSFQKGDIILRPGETAYIVTGGPFSQFPFSISTSFRENICQGYLEDYPFNPSLPQRCPLIANDPQIKTMTDQCYDYISGLGSCPNPQRTDRRTYDAQGSTCKAFVEQRIGYSQCVTQNRYTPNFSQDTWRVFLGQKKEMWAERRETITLYDKSGKVVAQASY